MFSKMVGNANRNFSNLPFGLDEDPLTRAWLTTSLFMLAMFAVLLPAYFFDSRLFEGASVWAKPIKFSLSLAIHFLTLAILAKQLSSEHKVGIKFILLGFAAIVAGLFEQLYISIQAGRGERSHFNLDSPFTAGMYQLMGVGAVLLVAASFVLGIMIWKHGEKNNSGLRLGSIVGLTMGSVLTLLYAGYMSGYGSNTVGESTELARKLPFVGWSRTLGDLRVPHFIATHMMQILPIVGVLADRYSSLQSRKLVAITAIVLLLISVLVFVLALSATPIL